MGNNPDVMKNKTECKDPIPCVDNLFRSFKSNHSEDNEDHFMKRRKQNNNNIIEEKKLVVEHKSTMASLVTRSNEFLISLRTTSDYLSDSKKSIYFNTKKTKMTSSNNIQSLNTIESSDLSKVNFSKIKLKKNITSIKSTKNITGNIYGKYRIFSNTNEIKLKENKFEFMDFEKSNSFELQHTISLNNEEIVFGMQDKKIGLKLEIIANTQTNLNHTSNFLNEEDDDLKSIRTLYCNSYGFISSSKLSAINSHYKSISENSNKIRKYSLSEKLGNQFLFSIKHSQFKSKVRLCNNKLDLSMKIKNKDSITSLISIEDETNEYLEILKFYYNEKSKLFIIHVRQSLYRITENKVRNNLFYRLCTMDPLYIFIIVTLLLEFQIKSR